MRCMPTILTLGLLSLAASADDLWELPPIRYSESSPVSPLDKDGAFPSGDDFHSLNEVERVRLALKALSIPEESQILVFSKTSKQNDLISPGTPRALYFSENAYAGYVPGGMMEVAVHDPVLGVVFYLIDLQNPAAKGMVHRETGDCLSCHGTARTEDVPGLLVRSVFPDADGRPLLALGSSQVDASTPLATRWGGYYVTGRSSLPHLGNRVFQEADGMPAPELTTLADVSGKLDARRYPRATSDIVSLMVLEHQCDLHNRMTAAAMRYRRTHWLGKLLDKTSDPDSGTAGRLADEDAKEIVDRLLFKDEAEIGDGVEGDESFQDAFTGRFPKTEGGDSLADFHLGSHLFKNRCSYMIYSQAFAQLPERIRTATLKRLRAVLDGAEAQEEFAYLKEPERKRISAILKETLPAFSN
jgi:hypothetical protein